jgi:sigma-B regulation protein RsbU (phosphoserine phosphatase)
LITLFLPSLLVLFIAETVARNWKKVAWWVVAAYLAPAVFGVAMLLAQGSPRLAYTANSIVVLLSIPVFILTSFFPRQRTGHDLQILRAGLSVFLLFAVFQNLANLGLIARSFRLEFIGFAVLLGCLGYVALARARRNEEQLLALNKELEIARNIQSQLLPPAASVPGLVTASRYVPASSVAGDFYDFLARDSALGVLIADVSGHGVPAALSASMVKVAVRSQAGHAGDPAAVLRGMNSILCGNLHGQFVSAGYLFLNPAQRKLHYAGAGHPPLLIWRSRPRQVEILEENGLLLGILADACYSETTAPLERGDRCVLYTDGFLEATCPDGEAFGSERLQGFLAENASLSPDAFCDALVHRLIDWRGEAGSQQDDLTIVAIDCA